MDITEQIKNYIAKNGAIPVNEFMRKAMSHYDGYYVNKLAIGSNADFITAPEISQLFGEIIGVWVANYWQENFINSNFNLVELGPGKATLMTDLLRATKHVTSFHSKLKIIFLEINKVLKEIQAKRLKDHKPLWLDKFEEIPKKRSIFIANEFFDTLPVIQYVRRKNLWYELMVDLKKDTSILHFTDSPIDQITQEMLQEEYPTVPRDGIIEICFEAKKIIAYMCDIIKKQGGAALIIDYGFTEEDRNTKSFISTLQGIKNHQYSNIFNNIGDTDLTVQVNFTDLINSVETNGCKATYMTQKDFLLNYGIEIRKSLLLKQSSTEQHSNIISGYNRLVEADQMGHLFKALIIEAR